MELFLFHFRQTGNTVEQVFLGISAYDTIEPANIEAVLSTNFKGNMSRKKTLTLLLLEFSNIKQTSPWANVEKSHCQCLVMAFSLKRVRHGSILEKC